MNTAITTVRSASELGRTVAGWHGADKTVALVPTMGGIHDGHLALVAAAGKACDRTVVSLFVNPTQFGASEDLDAYPRDEAADAALLAQAGADLLYAPPVGEMYPSGLETTVPVPGVADGLDGAARPGHFAGVVTVVARLFDHAKPDVALFGEKDYQQLLVIRRMARDLGLGVRVDQVATVREPDGLALSSRNAYLSAAERAVAPALYRTLEAVADRLAGGMPSAQAVDWGTAELLGAGFAAVDYLAVCDAATLAPLDGVDPARPARVLAAAHLGPARLIDNLAVG